MADRVVSRALERRRSTYADEVRRLVEAALGLMRESGELEPRVGAIVAAAGLSNQAFYRHFRSKHELLVAVLDEGLHRLTGVLAHRMEAIASPTEQIRVWLEGMVEQALHPEAAVATRPFALGRARLAASHPVEVAESERRLTALVEAALEEARACGELPSVQPARDAEALYHLAMGWVIARLQEQGPADGDDAARLVAFALAGLGGPG